MTGDPRLPARFWAKVELGGGGCWIWTASRKPNGYAQIRSCGRTLYAHRVSYEALVGPIPAGLDLDHLCRVRHCVRPDHLEAVDRATNIRRGMIAEVNRRRAAARTHCPQGHPYSPENTRFEKVGRSCRACSRSRRRPTPQRAAA